MSFLNKHHQEAYQFMETGDYAAAVEKYSVLIDMHPEEAVLYSERGVCFIHLKDQLKSLNDLDESVRLQPDYAYRYASRGHARDAFGDLDGAISDYQKAVELDPKDDILHNNLGVLLEKKGYQKQAKDAFDRSDKVRKAQEALDNLISEVEGVESNQVTEEVKQDTKPVAEEVKAEEDSTSVWSELGQLFSSPAQRKEFFKFVRNGFRLKQKDDKKRKG